MTEQELRQFVQDHVRPTVVELEEAKRLILQAFAGTTPPAEALPPPVAAIRSALCTGAGPVPDGYVSISPDLHDVRATLLTYLALQALHGTGALVACGQLLPEGTTDRGVQTFGYTDVRGGAGGLPRSVAVQLPAVYERYQLATGFDGTRFLLADGDIYLSHLPWQKLSSRVARCLREAVSAFRSGNYLSAAMDVGAASESLWLTLGRLVDTKNLAGASKLRTELARSTPNLSTVLDETWKVLLADCRTELGTVFATSTEREVFIEMARRLRDRRNYANHDDAADEEEVMFRFNETGMLLLDAHRYFSQHTVLLDAVSSMSACP